jgi:thiamine pyrophosphate-dependent acetolactate synthase large subunit-like protein/ABC-type nitrate/sulfonate/bicarbonate transport system substrate-binding protein
MSYLRTCARTVVSLVGMMLLGDATALAADQVTIAYIGGTADVGFYIADARGYLRDEGIEAKFTTFDSAARMVVPLATGEIDVGSGTVGAGTYNALERGVTLRAVADKARNMGAFSYQALVVRKALWENGEIRTLKDLKGRKFGMTTTAGNEAAVLDEALRTVGLTIADVNVTTLSMPQQVVTFTNGALDASFLPEPFLRAAVTSGVAVSLMPVSKLRDNDVTGVIIYRDMLINKRPEVAKRIMKADIRGLRDYVDALKDARLAGSGAEEVIDIISRYSVVKDKNVLRSIVPHFVDLNGNVGVESLEKDWAFYKRQGLIKGDVTVDQLIDKRWVDSAIKELGPLRSDGSLERLRFVRSTYVCLDVGLQEEKLEKELHFPDVDRFKPGAPPAPSAEAVEEAARLLVNAKKPVILMGRVSRSPNDWDTRIALAEALGAAVLTDMKPAAAFPTEHPLHPIEPRFRPSPASSQITKEADVILSLDWIDLKGHFIQTLGKDVEVAAKVIHCTLDDYLHNGWSMDHFGLPPADLKILSSPDQLVRMLLEAVHRLRGTHAKAEPKFPPRKTTTLSKPHSEGVMGLRDLALVVREFCDTHEVTMSSFALGWPSDTVNFRHPLDYVGFDGGGGVGSGPSHAVGMALAIKGSGRLPMTVIGDGDFAMGCTAFWSAAHMGIPLLVVIANNQVYYNDVAHQEHMANVRGRPVENKFVGQEMINPAIDLIAIAKAQGLDGEGPIMNAVDFAAALVRGEKIVRGGGRYVIDARVNVGAPGERDRAHTAGRRE